MKCLSLYTGCGGLDLGFHEAGFNTIWANELSEQALKTYENELIRTGYELPVLKSGDISEMELPDKGSVDVVIGGPPCQGFSVAGKMDPNDPRSRHVWEFFRVVEHMQPRAFVMENVKALAINQRWKGIREALQIEGERLGFQTRLLVLNAADYGVPQQRERMFLIGIKDCVMPIPPVHFTRVSVRESLKGLPEYGKMGNDSFCRAIITPAKSPIMRKSPFAGMLFNGQGRPMDLEQPALTLPASMGGNRTPIIDQKTLLEGDTPWVSGYHESLMAGGAVAKEIPTRLRRLTVEEAAKLQGFPDGMKFEGSQCSKFRQIGNAVPPPLAFAVATTLKKCLEGGELTRELQGDQTCWVAEDEVAYPSY